MKLLIELNWIELNCICDVMWCNGCSYFYICLMLISTQDLLWFRKSSYKYVIRVNMRYSNYYFHCTKSRLAVRSPSAGAIPERGNRQLYPIEPKISYYSLDIEDKIPDCNASHGISYRPDRDRPKIRPNTVDENLTFVTTPIATMTLSTTQNGQVVVCRNPPLDSSFVLDDVSSR
jgi:hypothetical protein